MLAGRFSSGAKMVNISIRLENRLTKQNVNSASFDMRRQNKCGKSTDALAHLGDTQHTFSTRAIL